MTTPFTVYAVALTFALPAAGRVVTASRLLTVSGVDPLTWEEASFPAAAARVGFHVSSCTVS